MVENGWGKLQKIVIILIVSQTFQAVECVKFVRSDDPVITGFARKHPSKTDDFQRAKSEGWANVFTADNPAPTRAFGRPGVALLDVDSDGDLDIYVPTGDRQPNQLFLNQLSQSGRVEFQEAGAKFGVQLEGIDSDGVCACDIDNDGDEDLIVLNSRHPWSLLRNDGGVFVDISVPQTDTSEYEPSSCTCADVNGDGLVDLLISTTFKSILGIFDGAFAYSSPNQLYINQGPKAEQHFIDETSSRGLGGYQGLNNGTWSAALVDFDMDGDLDVFFFDDRAGIFGTGRGMIKLYSNDGEGNFDWITEQAGFNLENEGANMGHAFGDLNCDGFIDLFVTRLGSIQSSLLALVDADSGDPCFEDESSQWVFGSEAGKFTFPGLGGLKANMFGWGAEMMDLENDGDLDIVQIGGMVSGPAGIVTPGSVFENIGMCSGEFKRSDALGEGAYNSLIMSGLAAGDFNDDCFPDYVAISGAEVNPAGLIAFDGTDSTCVVGSPFLKDALHYPVFAPRPDGLTWVNPVGVTPEGSGRLVLEMNDANSGNNGVRIRFRGSVGDIRHAQVNRDATGAIVSFTPEGLKTVMRPLTSGNLHSSSDKRQLFGMGAATKARVVVRWPGKPSVHNAFDLDLSDPEIGACGTGRTLVFPELPCDFKGSLDKSAFKFCVRSNLLKLRNKGIIDKQMEKKFSESMQRAYEESRQELV
ncbi:hypothetical protein BSKO_13771 [Bryopsis sp. KO-2023]|nr:hypothetical protein BSKO_13771 [Bryopsis sp. KO-2023]